METRRSDGRSLQAMLEVAAYSLDQASKYVGVPRETLRDWVRGRAYPLSGGRVARARPLVQLADPIHLRLSFNNLLEAHVLSAFRQHGVTLQHIRDGLSWLRRKSPSPHPLIDREMFTDGRHMFVRHLGELINASRDGQLAMEQLLELHLRRIERHAGLAVRLYPFTRPKDRRENAPALVMIDPRVEFGRPVLVSSSVPTAVIAERYQAGESVEDLAEDYGETPANIQEAIRSELQFARAA